MKTLTILVLVAALIGGAFAAHSAIEHVKASVTTHAAAAA